jgi:hypothetical protein
MVGHLTGEEVQQQKIVARTGYGIVIFTFAVAWMTRLFPCPFLSLACP